MIQKKTAARYKGVNLHIWAVNTFILYCKVAKLWEYVVAPRAYGIADYKNEADRNKEGAALVAWDLAPRATRGKMPVVPPALARMSDKSTFTSTSHYVKFMVPQLPPLFKI